MGKGLIDGMFGAIFSKKDAYSSGSQDYKRGYEACEQRYAALARERDYAVSALAKLGYELGEEPSVIKDAARIRRSCKVHTSCEGCALSSSSGCALKGDSPSDWKVV